MHIKTNTAVPKQDHTDKVSQKKGNVSALSLPTVPVFQLNKTPGFGDFLEKDPITTAHQKIGDEPELSAFTLPPEKNNEPKQKQSSVSTPFTVQKKAVIQRAVVLLDDNVDDYALIKALIGSGHTGNAIEIPANLANANAAGPNEYIISYSLLKNGGWRRNAESIKDDFDALPDPNLFTNDETIFIVGHGQPGKVWTKPDHEGDVTDFSEIVSWLKEILPDNWNGEIKVMTCNSTVAPDNKKNNKSVAKKISEAWNDGAEEENRIPVSGQAGFAYGMGNGTMAVLKSEFGDMYKAIATNGLADETIDHLVSKAQSIGASQVKDLINLDIKVYKNQELKKYVPDFFIAEKIKIETRLKEIVEADMSADIYAKKIAMQNDVEFMTLISKQKVLFTAFDLWNDDGEVGIE